MGSSLLNQVSKPATTYFLLTMCHWLRQIKTLFATIIKLVYSLEDTRVLQTKVSNFVQSIDLIKLLSKIVTNLKCDSYFYH